MSGVQPTQDTEPKTQAATNAPQADDQRWATSDFAAHEGCRAQPLVDGQAAMLAMCRAFLSAKSYILIAGWDLRADLPMVRGEDTHVGAAESDQQRALVASLRAEGLSDDALALWDANQLSVRDVLGFAVAHGVKVGVLLWDAINLAAHLTNAPAKEAKQLDAVGVECLLDDSSRAIRHITQSLHQKCAVVDGRVAFVGGIDLTCQADGDYDRWDTHVHLCASPERGMDILPTNDERGVSLSAAEHPWHDAHTRLEGPLVADVLRNITQRWGEVAAKHNGPVWPLQLDATPPAQIADGHTAQIVRTIPPHTYTFATQGIATIHETYLRELARAQKFVYLENQYLWPEVYIGLNMMRWGGRSPEMMELLEAMGAALERGVHLALTLPDHPNCGREFTDGGVMWLRNRAPQANAEGRLHVFTLGAADRHSDAPNGILYRPVYVHAKVALFDDQLWMVGSANLNSRGMKTDAEINVISADPATARGLRLRLWTEHLRPTLAEEPQIADPLAGLAVLRASALANQTRVERRELLSGHLLPYVTHAEGVAQRLPVDAKRGWLDNLNGGAGDTPDAYAERYL